MIDGKTLQGNRRRKGGERATQLSRWVYFSIQSSDFRQPGIAVSSADIRVRPTPTNCIEISMTKSSKGHVAESTDKHHESLVGDIGQLMEAARHSSARAINFIMTDTYWETGRRIVEFEQGGQRRAAYGEELLRRLARDLTARFGRGFSLSNLKNCRTFFLDWPKSQTPSGLSIATTKAEFPLPWSHYVRLMTVKSEPARRFYEAEALRGGWTVRQLDRQIGTLFYERTALSRNKMAMLKKGAKPRPGDRVDANGEMKEPFMLEFMNLRDEYSESDLEEALLNHLERFLLELGNGFTFVGRQRRLRIGGEWLRVDLLFFHRRLRCLVVIDLKIGKFTPADAGQMHTYLNYAREHWMEEGENPPVGLILCSEQDDALARYALDGLPNKVLAREYRLVLPDEKQLATEIEQTRQIIETRVASKAQQAAR
jgi:predicted nuclease of restriction endonuclease-like (RecB) superfamily